MKKATKAIEKTIETICCAFLVFMVFCALTQVISRFILHIPVPWTEEYAKMSYIVIILLMWSVLEAKDAQLKVTYFYEKFSIIPRSVLFFMINLSYLAFTALFFFGSIKAMMLSWDIQYSAMKWMNAGIQYIPALISMPFAFLFVLLRMFNYKTEIMKKDGYELEDTNCIKEELQCK